MDDQQCLDNIRRGGKLRVDAISALYRAHARRFLGYLMKHRVPREHAEELVQDAFVNIVRHCEAFRGDTRFDAWMWAIVRNALIDYFRRRRPEELVDDADLETLVNAAAAADVSTDASEELGDCVRKAYASFAAAQPDRAEILSRLVFEEWSIQDIAAVLKRTPGATREYLSQCRKKLSVFLAPCREFLEG